MLTTKESIKRFAEQTTDNIMAKYSLSNMQPVLSQLISNCCTYLYDTLGYDENEAKEILKTKILPTADLPDLLYDILPAFSDEGQKKAEQEKAEYDTFKAWLSDLIPKLCNKKSGDNYLYVIEPQSYNEYISPSDIMNAYAKYELSIFKAEQDVISTSFADFLTDHLISTAWTEDNWNDISFVNEIKYAVNNSNSDAIKNAYSRLDIDELIDLAYELNYGGVTLNLDSFLSQYQYKLNISMTTKKEQDSDMSAIMTYFENPESNVELEDNALCYLIKQQGYDISSIQNPDDDDTLSFIESVANELDNMPYSMSELTFLVHANGIELCNLLEAIAKRKLTPDATITMSEYSTCGLFNEWLGTGSDFDINLDKPAVFPVSMIRDFQMENVHPHFNSSYTVDDVYGFIDKVWDGEAAIA